MSGEGIKGKCYAKQLRENREKRDERDNKRGEKRNLIVQCGQQEISLLVMSNPPDSYIRK